MQIDNVPKTTEPEPIKFTWLTQGEEVKPGATEFESEPVADCWNCSNIGLAFVPSAE